MARDRRIAGPVGPPRSAARSPVPHPLLAGLLDSRLATELADSEGVDPARYELRATDLLKPASLHDAIGRMPPKSRSQRDEAISGTLFAKSYSLVALSVLTAFSLSDLRLSARLEAVRLSVTAERGLRVLLRPEDDDTPPAPEAARRDGLAELLRELVAGNCASVFETIHRETGARMQTMWALLSTNIRNTYLRVEQQAQALGIGERRLRVIADDRAVVFSPDALEGHNPLVQPTRLYVPETPGAEPTYLRNRCCLRYRISVDGERVPYCLTCPLISDRERERMIAEHHRSQRT
ncbi:MAG: hypothetical protein ACOC1U_10125 [Spirochaetota bacterium]